MSLRAKNRTKNIVILVLIIIVGFLIYKNYLPNLISFKRHEIPNDSKTNQQAIEKVPLERVTFKIKKYKEETSTNRVELSYPEIYDLSVKKSNDEINAFIKQEVFSLKDNFFADLSNEIFLEEKNEFSTDEPNVYVAFNYVNISLTAMEYASGAAHPVNNARTYVFNSNDAHRVALAEIFANKSTYLKTLSKLADIQVSKVLDSQAVDYDYKTGLLPQEKNYSQFLFTQEGLELIFNPYQVAPYVMGIIKINIPWSELTAYLTPEFAKNLKNFQ